MQELTGGSLHLFCAVEFLHVLGVLLLQTVDDLVGTVRVLLIQVVRDLHQ